MTTTEYVDIVRKNCKMFNIFFEEYVAAQLKECCESQSDRWGISARAHKEFVSDYTGINTTSYRDAEDYYLNSLDTISSALSHTDYEEAENPFETDTVWGQLAGECWDILNTHQWWMKYYDEWLEEKEDE
jgi:hypothetical protein